jgi:hypothetical protein
MKKEPKIHMAATRRIFFFLSDPKGEVFNLKAYFKKRADKILHLYSHDTAPARPTAERWNFFS